MSISHDLQLLSLPGSPFVMRAKLALTVKGVPFTDVPQDLAHKSDLLLQSNPIYKQIPVLIHNGRPICESLNIVEYIDEAFLSPDGKDLLPKDPYDRAIARFWADYIDKKIFGSLVSVVRNSGADKMAFVEEVKSYMTVLEGGLATVGKEHPFFGGANVGFADISLGPAVVWIPTVETIFGIQLVDEKVPRLTAWMKEFQQFAVAANLPSSQTLVERLRARFPTRF